MVVATVAFCLGGILVGGAAIFLLLMLGDLRALWTLRRIPVTDAGDQGRAAVEGITEIGPAGPQVAPVTGAECAWYRVTLVRSPGRASDFDDVLLEVTSPAWPTLDGKIPVDPRMLELSIQNEPGASVTTRLEHRRSNPVRLPRIVPPDVVDGLRGSEELRLTEVRVSRGQRVFALGRITRDGLRPSRAGFSVFSTDSRDRVIAARREAVGMGGRTVVLFGLAGLLLAGGSAAWLTTMS